MRLIHPLAITLGLLIPSLALAGSVLPAPSRDGGFSISSTSCGDSVPAVLPIDDGSDTIPEDWALSAELADQVNAALDPAMDPATFDGYDDCLMRSIEKLRKRLVSAICLSIWIRAR